jgi:hypothetical protein
VPAGTTTHEYVDVFVNAAFGAVGVTDANALRAAGAAPTAGRVLLGNVLVRTDANVQIGSGDVVIERVTPWPADRLHRVIGMGRLGWIRTGREPDASPAPF